MGPARYGRRDHATLNDHVARAAIMSWVLPVRPTKSWSHEDQSKSTVGESGKGINKHKQDQKKQDIQHSLLLQ